MWLVVKNLNNDSIGATTYKILKEFPHREQCVTWCYEEGYITEGRGRKSLSDNIKIILRDD